MHHTSSHYLHSSLAPCWCVVTLLLYWPYVGIPFISLYIYWWFVIVFYVAYLVAMTISFRSEIKSRLYLPACLLYPIKLHPAEPHWITNVNATTTNCCNTLCSIKTVCHRAHTHGGMCLFSLHFGASFNLKSNLALTVICKQTVCSHIFHC